MKNIEFIVGSGINAFAHIYMWSKLQNKKVDFKKMKNWAHILVMIGIILLNYFYVNSLVKITIITLVFMIFNYMLFHKTITETIIAPICSQFIIMISEVLFALIIVLIFKLNATEICSTYAGALITNALIAFISILLVNLKMIKKLYIFLVEISRKIKKQYLLILLILFVLSMNVLFVNSYYKISLPLLLITNLSINIFYLIIIILIIITKNRYIKINLQYNLTLSSLKEYEEILNKYRISNHENKNQLLTIRNMILKKEKKVPCFIDKIIDNKLKDNEKLLFDVNVIPEGGLRAVVYSKMLYMKEKGIEVNLLVDNKLRTFELIELGDDLILDVCKIVGVYLDNAIEEVEKSKKKQIGIELFINDNCLNIAISNTYKGTIDIDKLDEIGYTTKNKGHGYGLSLVKEILEFNNKLYSQKRISKDVFTQTLKIKMSKKTLEN